MTYVGVRAASDLLAEQTAVALLCFAEHDSCDPRTDTRVIVGMLWSFWAHANRLASLPRFEVPQPRRGVSDEVRDRVFARDGDRCLKCGDFDSLEVDHVVAIAVGGLHEESNFQTLCRTCNREKGSDSVDYRQPMVRFSGSGASR